MSLSILLTVEVPSGTNVEKQLRAIDSALASGRQVEVACSGLDVMASLVAIKILPLKRSGSFLQRLMGRGKSSNHQKQKRHSPSADGISALAVDILPEEVLPQLAGGVLLSGGEQLEVRRQCTQAL